MGNKEKFYSLNNILSKDCQYNIIFGERSNGKTFAVCEYGLTKYVESDCVEQMAVVRRWDLDFKGNNGRTMFNSLVATGKVEKITNGEWNDITYESGQWFLSRFDDSLNKRIYDSKPFAYAFAISLGEHYKSTSYPNITTILFDEFLTRKSELPNEFVEFMNILSTIIRQRNNVKIFMCGNTINQYSIYYKEMGLSNVRKMKKGQIDIYTYGDSGLRVAVEYSDSPSKKKASDVYFAFENSPQLKMITQGAWELAIYPHLTQKYLPKNIAYIFFIVFEEHILQCEIISIDSDYFIYIHNKTTPIKDDNENLVYSLEYSDKVNYRRKLTKPVSSIEKKIFNLFVLDRIRYQDNEIGEIVRQYLVRCTNENIISN